MKNIIFDLLPFNRFSKASWRNFITLGISQLGILAIGIMSNSLWARHVSQLNFGQYQTIYSLVGIIASFSLNGLAESLSISSAKGFCGNFQKIFKIKLSTDLIGSLVLFGIGGWYSKTNPIFSHGLYIAALFFPFLYLQNIWLPWLNGQGAIKKIAKFQVLEPLLSLAILSSLILSHQTQSTPLFLFALMGGTSLFSLFVLMRLKKSLSNSLADWGIVKYGLHVSAINLLGWIVATDKIIIYRFLSSEAVAVYTIALFFPTQFKLIFSVFNKLLLPGIYRAKSVTESWHYLKPRFHTIVPVFSSLGLFGFFVIPVLIPLLFSRLYVESVPYARWLWLWWGLTSPLGFIHAIMVSQQKRLYLLIHSVGYPLIIGTLYILLIPRYGLWGAILANLISGFIAGIYPILSLKYFLRHEAKGM
ncbi:MAG: hypothetical protein LHV69_00695 [Elusimicrobia bacterium]|nr:hypothetical protein [Candidatus Obscuribacterium magneticum]